MKVIKPKFSPYFRHDKTRSADPELTPEERITDLRYRVDGNSLFYGRSRHRLADKHLGRARKLKRLAPGKYPWPEAMYPQLGELLINVRISNGNTGLSLFPPAQYFVAKVQKLGHSGAHVDIIHGQYRPTEIDALESLLQTLNDEIAVADGSYERRKGFDIGRIEAASQENEPESKDEPKHVHDATYRLLTENEPRISTDLDEIGRQLQGDPTPDVVTSVVDRLHQLTPDLEGQDELAEKLADSAKWLEGTELPEGSLYTEATFQKSMDRHVEMSEKIREIRQQLQELRKDPLVQAAMGRAAGRAREVRLTGISP